MRMISSRVFNLKKEILETVLKSLKILKQFLTEGA
jgi:hypothetical protein